MTRLPCLLFDSDGTLVDSEILLAGVLGEILPQFDLPFTASQYLKEFRGVRFLTIIETLAERHDVPLGDRYTALEANMREGMEQRMRAELLPIDGMREALLALPDHLKAVVSNGPEKKIRCAMKSSGLAPFFEERLFSAYTLGTWKPDPALYRQAGEMMGFAPNQCVVIDDAAVGVTAGLEAGMHVVHLNRFPDEEATPDGAIAIHHASELPSAIDRLSR
ncbi:HAD-IA family hydrolase [Chromohalobacter israelensis]|uniref:HAD-IA family hydrolase n=1 Tax=Chromohalobacter israelensis TaxID=141390 RepID=UPI000A065F23|nr:HAD-IA family hydrolase [Chromohalobacter israelensis]MDF9435698.1 HAD-IA family hydrolase [Chromohalobacter israelensis]